MRSWLTALFSDPVNDDPEKKRHLIGLSALFLFGATIFVLSVFNDTFNPLFAFDRDAIVAGEWWRLISANFVHLNVNHMLFNVSVYMLTTLLFSSSVKLWQWFGVLVVCCLSVGLGLYIFDRELDHYVGLSGALYGLLAFGLLRSLRSNLWLYLVIYTFIHYKVIKQQMPGFDADYMRDFIGDSVIASAHLYGIVAGNIIGLVFFCLNKKTTSSHDISY